MLNVLLGLLLDAGDGRSIDSLRLAGKLFLEQELLRSSRGRALDTVLVALQQLGGRLLDPLLEPASGARRVLLEVLLVRVSLAVNAKSSTFVAERAESVRGLNQLVDDLLTERKLMVTVFFRDQD